MQKSMGKNSVPFLLVGVYPMRIKHVFREESLIPEANQGENNGKSKDIIGYHYRQGSISNSNPKLVFLGLCRRIHLYY